MNTTAAGVVPIPLCQINFDAFNFRGDVDPMHPSIQELAASIGSQGMINPLTVVENLNYISSTSPRYDLVCGHRRFLALQSLGEDRADCIVRHVGVGYRPSEETLLALIADENDKRADFLPSELCRVEAALKARMTAAGLVSTREAPRPGRPSYAAHRAAQTGLSERTVEQRVRLGEAHPALLQAADVGTVSRAGAYSLAAFDRATQVHVCSYLSGQGITHASPQEVAAAVNAVRQRQGLPAIKHGEAYQPSTETVTLGQRIEHQAMQIALLRGALEFYAAGTDESVEEGGHMARVALDAARDDAIADTLHDARANKKREG